jgi:hypothetical protein
MIATNSFAQMVSPKLFLPIPKRAIFNGENDEKPLDFGPNSEQTQVLCQDSRDAWQPSTVIL